MMKKTILFLLLSVPALLQAQELESLVDTNKLWSSLYQLAGPPFHIMSTYEKFSGDTTIGTHHYYKVWYSQDSLMASWTLSGFIREDSTHKVFYRFINDTSEGLIYDFGLQEGDTVQIDIGPIITFRASTVDSVFVYDKYVKRIFLEEVWTKGGPKHIGNVWYEGIGDLCGVLHPGAGSMMGVIYDLLCYFEDGILKYHLPAYSNCYQNTVGLENLPINENEVSVFPNPVTSFSVLDFSKLTSQAVTIDIFNTSGALIKRERSINNLELNRTDFKPGLYFYRLESNNGVVNGRFIVR